MEIIQFNKNELKQKKKKEKTQDKIKMLGLKKQKTKQNDDAFTDYQATATSSGIQLFVVVNIQTVVI